MFSEFWHTRVSVFKICIFNCACYTSVFTIFKGPCVTHILYSSLLCSLIKLWLSKLWYNLCLDWNYHNNKYISEGLTTLYVNNIIIKCIYLVHCVYTHIIILLKLLNYDMYFRVEADKWLPLSVCWKVP